MLAALAAQCRSAKEKNLFILALIFSSLVWVALVVSLVGLLYAPFIALGIVIGHAFFLARLTGNSIRVGSRQLPELYKKVENAASKLGLERMPEVYVVSGHGVLNAFATKLFSRHFVILHAEILDACEAVDEGKQPGEPSAVDFIIGHELGHLALGHLSMAWLLAPASLVPLLGPAYSRAKEYSADRCGLAVVDDVDASSRALAVLAAGGRQARKVSLDGLLEQRHDTGGLVMALVELNSSHPFLSKRVAALHRAKDAAIGPDVGRNPLSYVMAPFFGMAAGGVGSLVGIYVCVAVVGVMAAVALPAFEKYQQRSKLAAALLAPPADDTLARHDEPAADLANLFAPPPPLPPSQLPPSGLDSDGDGPRTPVSATVDAAPPRFEARTWLKGQIVAKNPEAVANYGTVKAAVLVDKLYKAGAPKVWVTGVGVDDKGVYATAVVAQMPSKVTQRKKLIDLCSTEYKKLGQPDCEDAGPEATSEISFGWQ